jgi:hypothetical protein
MIGVMDTGLEARRMIEWAQTCQAIASRES